MSGLQSPSLFQIFASFFRLGLTAFGGPAMIPHMRRLVIESNGWLDEADFQTGLAVCQAVPGATVVQLAAFVGLRLRGLAGALVAFLAFALPAFLLITLLSILYFRYQDLPRLLSAFDGLKAVVVAIVAGAALDFCAKYCRTGVDRVLALTAAILFVFKVHPVLILLGVTGAGLLILPRPTSLPPQRHGDQNFRAALFFSGGLVAGLILLRLASNDLFQLARTMMAIDLVAFGGGFAALPIMLHEVVTRLGWMSQAVFMDGIALGQVTPGPIVLTSAFVGYAQFGLSGALAGAAGIFTPSLLILLWVVPICDRLLTSLLFRKILRGSLASLGGFMAAVAATLGAGLAWSFPLFVLAVTAFIALRRQVDVLWVVTIGCGTWTIFSLL